MWTRTCHARGMKERSLYPIMKLRCAMRWQVLAITQGSGSVALSYVNFPVKVVIKSCKLIPTMALGIFILRRAYSAMEYCAAGMLCIGVAAFTLVDSKVSPKFDVTGIALLCLAVAGDSFTVNLQVSLPPTSYVGGIAGRASCRPVSEARTWTERGCRLARVRTGSSGVRRYCMFVLSTRLARWASTLHASLLRLALTSTCARSLSRARATSLSSLSLAPLFAGLHVASAHELARDGVFAVCTYDAACHVYACVCVCVCGGCCVSRTRT